MLNRILLLPALFIGKLAMFLSRKMGVGGGSSAPGRIALKLCPGLIARLSSCFSGGVLIVTATNGKTTTTRMIAAGLQAAGLSVVYNISGANMEGGIATALIEAASLRGYIDAEWGLFEIDEGSFPKVAPQLSPRAILIGNFFRDQLDRYGEVSILINKVHSALRALPSPPKLLLNADDPMVTSLGTGWTGSISWFGIHDPAYGFKGLQEDADIRNCPLCQAPLSYRVAYVGHLGSYACRSCGFKRPEPDYRAEKIQLNKLDSQRFVIRHKKTAHHFSIGIPGEHIVYNLLGAASMLDAVCGVNVASLPATYSSFRPPYGRFEILNISGTKVYLVLIKNPAGANVILRLIKRVNFTGPFLFLLNDLSADGRDISWIYDAGFEAVAGLKKGVISGRRAAEMQLRLILAGCSKKALTIQASIDEAFESALALGGPKKPLFILSTYTAMHEVRRAMAARADLVEFWKEQ